MVYALFIGDPHVQGHTEYAKSIDKGLTDQHLIHLNTLIWIADLIRYHKPQWVIVMGDTFEVPGLVEADDMSVAWRGFNAIWDACQQVGANYKILVGNHDIHIGEGTAVHIHSVSVLQGPYKNSVVSSPQADRDREGNQAYFIPYSSDYNWVKAQLLLAETLGCKFAATHVDAAGMLLNAVHRSNSGLNPSEIERLWVFNGHHHYPERCNSNWVNTGSPTYQSFRDNVVDIPRGPVLWDGKNRVEWLENPYTDIYHTLLNPTDEETLQFVNSVDASRLRLRVKTSNKDYSLPEGVESRIKSYKKSYIPKKVKIDRKGVLSDKAIFDPTLALDEYLRRFPTSSQARSIIEAELSKHASMAASYKDVQFHFVSGKDFLSFKSFRLPLKEQNTFFLTGIVIDQPGVGSNGSGKTSLVESIQYALFGCISKRGVSASDFIREGADTCQVTLEFSIDGTPYQVVRSHSRTAGGKLLFYEDGKLASSRTISANQQKIIETIGFSHLDFIQLAYLNERKSFESLSDADKKTLIESISGAPVFATAYKGVDDARKKFSRSKLVEHAQLRLTKCQSEYDYFMKNTYIPEEVCGQRKAELQTAIDTEKQRLRSLISSKTSVTKAISEFTSVNVDSIVDESTRMLQQLSAYRAKFEVKLRQTEIDLHALQTDISLLERKASGRCPTCQQTTCLDHQELSKLTELKSQLPVLNQIKLTAQSELQSCGQKLNDLEIKRHNAFVTAQAKQAELTELKHRRAIFESDIVRSEQAISKYESQLNSFEDIIKKLDTEKHRLYTMLCEAELEFAEAKQQEDAYAEALSVLGPEGIRAYLVDQVLTVLNEVLEETALAFGGIFKAVILPETKRTSSVVQRLFLKTTPRAYHKLSKGQAKRIDLLIHLALSKCASLYKGSVSLMVMDEVEHGLDAVGIQALADYLCGLNKTVFFVSQDQRLRSLFDKTYTVQYQNGVSALVSSDGEY